MALAKFRTEQGEDDFSTETEVAAVAFAATAGVQDSAWTWLGVATDLQTALNDLDTKAGLRVGPAYAAQGDIKYMGASAPVNLTLGDADQFLRVNAGGTSVEWADFDETSLQRTILGKSTATENFNVASASEAAVQWDNQDFIDTDSFTHSTSTNNSRLTVDEAGVYDISWVVPWDNADGNRVTIGTAIWVNGTKQDETESFTYNRGTAYGSTAISQGRAVISLSASDYIEIKGWYQDRDASATRTTTTDAKIYVSRTAYQAPANTWRPIADMNDLGDAVITGTPADHEVLAYDSASSDWINMTAAEALLLTTSHTSTYTHADIATNKSHADSTHAPTNADNTAANETYGTGAEIKTAYEAEANAFTDTLYTKLGTIDDNADVTSTNETSHTDVVVDGDFSANGLLKRTAAGTYTSITDSSSDWDDAKTHADSAHAPSGAEANPALVSQAEAEAGTATTERIFSALRVAQAIAALETGGTTPALDDLTDVVVTGTPADNEVLAYDTGGNWINQTAAEAGLAPIASPNFTGTPQVSSVNIATVNTNWVAADITDFATQVGTDETDHSDVVVDGDFSSNGILKRTGAGAYGIVTDNSSTWDALVSCTTANVTSAGALMDTEVDADIKTLALPASTTISVFGASLIDDADAAAGLATLGAAPLASPTFTGTVTLPTTNHGTNYTDVGEIAAPANPGANVLRMYVDSTSNELTVKDSAGTATSLMSTGGGSHNLLSSTHSDTATASPTQGDLLVADATPEWTVLSPGSKWESPRYDGTDTVWSADHQFELYGIGDEEDQQISTGVLTYGKSKVRVQAEGGTADDLVTVTHASSLTDGDLLWLTAYPGDTITVKATGNIVTNGDIELTDKDCMMLVWDNGNGKWAMPGELFRMIFLQTDILIEGMPVYEDANGNAEWTACPKVTTWDKHFLFAAGTTSLNSNGIYGTMTGTGGSVTVPAGYNDGVHMVATGNNSGDGYVITMADDSNGNIHDSTVKAVFEGWLNVDPSNKNPTEWMVLFGLNDTQTGRGQEEMTYAASNYAFGNNNWWALTTSGGTTTQTDTGVLALGGGWDRLKCTRDNGNSQVLFHINETVVATHTTNLPTSSTVYYKLDVSLQLDPGPTEVLIDKSVYLHETANV